MKTHVCGAVRTPVPGDKEMEGGIIALLSLVVSAIVIVVKAFIPRRIKELAVDGTTEIIEALLAKVDKEFRRILGEQYAQNVVIQLGTGGLVRQPSLGGLLAIRMPTLLLKRKNLQFTKSILLLKAD